MSAMNRITSVEDLQLLLERTDEQPLLLFKHSTRCPISAGALREVEAHLDDAPRAGVTYGLIYVVENRELSNEAAARLGVKHESPQAILVKNGQAVWHTSHSSITKNTLNQLFKS